MNDQLSPPAFDAVLATGDRVALWYRTRKGQPWELVSRHPTDSS